MFRAKLRTLLWGGRCPCPLPAPPEFSGRAALWPSRTGKSPPSCQSGCQPIRRLSPSRGARAGRSRFPGVLSSAELLESTSWRLSLRFPMCKMGVATYLPVGCADSRGLLSGVWCPILRVPSAAWQPYRSQPGLFEHDLAIRTHSLPLLRGPSLLAQLSPSSPLLLR